MVDSIYRLKVKKPSEVDEDGGRYWSIHSLRECFTDVVTQSCQSELCRDSRS
ncbi:MAG: hypothetical protein HON65_14850 [Rhodospirillales bacterium]|nr:hypothetical protein [Rhodospirillales bacterium]